MKKGIATALMLTAAFTAAAQGTAEDYRRAAELPRKFAASQVSGWVSGVEWTDDSTYKLKYYSDPAPQQERPPRRPEMRRTETKQGPQRIERHWMRAL